jgi:hypothetical protein
MSPSDDPVERPAGGELEVDWGQETLSDRAERWRSGPQPNAINGIAFALIGMFGATLLGTLAAGIWLLATRQANEAEVIITRILVPYLQAVGNFASTLFGPLLAFILGYYFATRRRY